jgi:hypothetical protein
MSGMLSRQSPYHTFGGGGGGGLSMQNIGSGDYEHCIQALR